METGAPLSLSTGVCLPQSSQRRQKRYTQTPIVNAPSAGGDPRRGDPPADLVEFSQFNQPPPPMITTTIDGVQFKVTRLKTRGPRKGETLSRNSQHGAGFAVGSVRDSDLPSGGASHAVGAGKGMTITRVTGMGKVMVADLEAVMTRARDQHRADRRAAARDRISGAV